MTLLAPPAPGPSAFAPSHATGAAGAEAQLVRALGTRQLTASIFNYTVGSGIFALPALVVAQIGGAAPYAYVLCAFVALLNVLVFAEAGSRVTISGGPYAYVEVGLGPLPGIVAGILCVVTDITAAGAIAMLLAGSVSRLLGIDAPLVLGGLATLILVALAVVNVRGVRTGARVVELSTVAKLAPLLLFVVVGAFFIVPANLHVGAVPGIGKITAAAGTLFFAFSGIESALVPGGEVREPHRTVPRAAILALVAVTLLYLGVQTVALGLLGPRLATDQVTPLASAASVFAGNAGRTLLVVGAGISMFGWLTGALLAGPRAIFALARDGFLPARLTAVHARFRTPHVAIATYTVMAVTLALTGSFERLAILSNVAALGLYFMSAIAVLRLRARGVASAGTPFRIPGGPTVPILSCLVIAWVVSQTVTAREIVALGIVVAIAVVGWALRRRRRI